MNMAVEDLLLTFNPDDIVVAVVLLIISLIIFYNIFASRARVKAQLFALTLFEDSLKLAKLSRSELINLGSNELKKYVEMCYLWSRYQLTGGSRSLSTFELPIGKKDWQEVAEYLVDVNQYGFYTVACSLKYSFLGVPQALALVEYESGLPSGFRSGETIFSIVFFEGKLLIIQPHCDDYPILGENISRTSILPSKEKIRYRISYLYHGDRCEVVFVANGRTTRHVNENGNSWVEYDTNGAMRDVDWINQQVMEQQKVGRRRLGGKTAKRARKKKV